jgi:hypothetical protein
VERPATRQQRWRARHQQDCLIVPVEISFLTVHHLINLGWLSPQASLDRKEIGGRHFRGTGRFGHAPKENLRRVYTAARRIVQSCDMNRAPIPLRPGPTAVREANMTTLTRAGIVVTRSAFERRSRPAEIGEQMWPDDRTVPLIMRGEATPASLTSAAALAKTIVTDFLVTLGPAPVAAQLLAQGLQTKFDRAGLISVPSLVVDGGAIAFTGREPIRPVLLKSLAFLPAAASCP